MSKAAGIESAPDMLEFARSSITQLVEGINHNSQDPEEWVKKAVDHLAKENPGMNVLIIDNKHPHIVTLQNSAHEHVELNKAGMGTNGFDIHIFESGRVTKLGDGGWKNWGFSGNFKRSGDQGHEVEFSKIE